ncbi:phage tail tape measure protein [Rhodococcus zopfii]|uniref:Phage tail tape measure protein n=1 Tax=Rhodococcus zopfii TaxID=43772 RepID=A0ABU3WTD1_9NOCA|nr:phage tail tape measure protein [Rhodococcus zopfii]
MALDVGELVARLTLDDSRFVQGTQRAEQQSRQSTQRITNGFQDISRAAQRASQAAQAVEINRRLEQQARDAAQRIQELERNAQRADQSVDDITMNTQLLNDARRAAQQIEDIRAAARQAAGAVDNIELGNRLQQDLRAAQDELGNLYDQAAEGGGDAGSQSGGNFLSGFSDAIGDLGSKTGPVAGSILGIAALGLTAGAMLAAAIKDGMQAELQRDLFQAQTGTTVAQAEKFARAAGEAYADVFGESVEENLSTLKLALQNNIIDPGATQRDAEKVVAQLDTISTALDTEVSQSVKAVSALMSTGLAASAEEAADMIANAVGGSANKDEDLLEVIWEYAAGWKNAGIEAQTALALIEQSTDSGAWNADVASDALREFGRRISEEGDAMVEGMDSIGLSGQEMFDDFVAGGERSNQAFDKLFDKIRSIEDPVLRNEAILAVLGDTAGDFFDVFASWDPSEALKNFGEFEGAAGRLAATMGGNAATSVEGAMRSISVVADGLKAALAEAFGPYIAEWADQISNNRAGVIQFFIDVGNGAFDGAEAVLGFVSQGMRGLAEFADAGTDMSVSFLRSLADMIDGLTFLDSIPGFSALIPDMGDASDKLDRLADAAERGGEGIASGTAHRRRLHRQHPHSWGRLRAEPVQRLRRRHEAIGRVQRRISEGLEGDLRYRCRRRRHDDGPRGVHRRPRQGGAGASRPRCPGIGPH